MPRNSDLPLLSIISLVIDDQLSLLAVYVILAGET